MMRINPAIGQSMSPGRLLISLFHSRCRFTSILFLLAFLPGRQGFSQWTTSGNNIYNSNTGNVGIGITAPLFALDVNGNIRANSQLLVTGGNAGVVGTCLSTHIFNACGSLGYITFGFKSTTGANTATPDPLTIQQSNLSVGVNNNNPKTNLDVGGYISASSGLTVGANAYSGNVPLNGFTLTNSGNLGTFSIGSGGGFGYKFTTNGIDRLDITDTKVSMLNSNVLIGTSTDNGNSLQVNGKVWAATGLILPTGAAAGKVLTSDASGNATWQTASGGGSAGWALGGNSTVNPATTFVGTTDNTPVAFRTNNLEHMRIDGVTGNVGIGTTAPQSLLAVEGTITSQKVVVTQTGWADYVFRPSYQLLPLKDLDKFIRANRHLPELPTAEEVKNQGDDLGANQVALLKKVEELTLYIIEQDKKRKEQDRQLREQKERIDRLERLIGHTKQTKE